MASKLLNVLKDIENDRQYLVDLAQSLGYPIHTDASFRDLETVMQPIPTEPTDPPTFDIPEELIVKEDWVRPAEWPDCHQILLDTEPIVAGNTTYDPYMIIMIKANGPDTLIYKSKTGWYNNTGTDSIQWNRIKTSDGVIYTQNNVDTTHTWDTTKDIVVTEGAFPGVYRYLIYYTIRNSTTAQSLKGIGNLPAVEIIMDATNCSQNYYYAPITHFANQSDLLNIEVFNAGSNPVLYFADSYSRCFQDLINLRNLDFHDVHGTISLAWDYNNTFMNAHRLRYIDLSNWNVNYGAGNKSPIGFSLKACYSLVSFKSPYQRVTNNNFSSCSLLLGYNPQLTEIVINGDPTLYATSISFPTDVEDHTRCYVPNNINTTGRFYSNSALLPINWGKHNYITAQYFSDTAYPASGNNYPYFGDHTGALVYRDILDLSHLLVYCNRLNGVSIFSNNPNSYQLFITDEDFTTMPVYEHAVVLYPIDMCTRLLIRGRLDRDNTVRLFNNLLDLTGVTDTVYNPDIKIAKKSYNLLSAADIAIATNKGWTITVE